jgi:UDP-N-acetylmuramate--alanine ligase
LTRSREEIGSGLLPARAGRPIAPGQRIHVVGAAGAGASAAALLASAAGASVSGCDAGGPSPYTDALASAGIPLDPQHDPRHVSLGDEEPAVDRLAVTKALTSIDPDHPELAAARRAGLPVEPWQQVIADAAATHCGRLVAVAGTHGKSTSTGWLVHLLVEAGRDPAAFVGALLPIGEHGRPSTARWGRGDTFVVEADEYAGNFDPYRPDVAVLLNAEWDHPDVFADAGAVLDAFEGWVRASSRAHGVPTLVANVTDPGVAQVVSRLTGWEGRIVRVRLDDGATGEGTDAELVGRIDLEAEGRSRMTLSGPLVAEPFPVDVTLPGRHALQDALAVAGAALVVGVPTEDIASGLASFRGVGRRLELKGEPGGVTVLDDYGHHPTAIAATLAAVRQRYPGRPVWAVYEPLTFHRTAAMLDAFADVLATADHVVIADIWAGRDPDTTIASAESLASAVTARGRAAATAPGSVERTADHLATRVAPGDVVLVMGGGRSYVIAERLVSLLDGSGVSGG